MLNTRNENKKAYRELEVNSIIKNVNRFVMAIAQNQIEVNKAIKEELLNLQVEVAKLRKLNKKGDK